MRWLAVLSVLAALGGCAADATAVLDGHGEGDDGTWTASVACGRESELRAHLGLVGQGHANLLVKDGRENLVFNQTYGPEDSTSLDTRLAGRAGEWTVSLVGDAYEGRFSITLGC